MDIPFNFTKGTFRAGFLENYMLPLADWMCRRESSVLTAQETGSPWETALCSIYLLDLLDICEDTASEAAKEWCRSRRSEILSNVTDAVRWMMSVASTKKVIHDGKTMEETCWERVTWDTATVIRSQLMVKSKLSERLTVTDQKLLDEKIIGGVVWLVARYGDWENHGKYSFGNTDLAAGAFALIRFLQQSKGLPSRVIKSVSGQSAEPFLCGVKETLERIVNTLLSSATSPSPDGIPDIKPSLIVEFCQNCWWDDYFTTSEVTEVLCEYIGFETSENLSFINSDIPLAPDDVNLRHERGNFLEKVTSIRSKVVAAMRYFELTQVDGGWGSHIDTIKALYAYIKISALLAPQDATHPNLGITFSTQSHIAFKALRWLCDYKQFFYSPLDKQGYARSFMHTMFLSCFCGQTFVAVYANWKPSKKEAFELFDDVIWSAPCRISEGHAEKTKIEAQLDRVIRENSLQQEKLKYQNDELNEGKKSALLYRDIAITAFFTSVIYIILMIITAGVNINPAWAFKEFAGSITLSIAAGAFLFKILHAVLSGNKPKRSK